MEIKDFNYQLELKDIAEKSSEKRETSDNKNQKHEEHEEKEIIEKRGMNSKTFQIQKGKFVTTYYNAPIHKYDEFGTFIEAKKGIEKTENGEEFVGGDSGVIFYNRENSNALFTMSRGDYQATVSLKKAFGKQINHSLPMVDKEHKKLCYKDIIPETDIDCILTVDGVKLSILSKNPKAKERYAFVITCENLKCNLEQNKNTIRFSDVETDVTVFEFFAPFMTDALGVYSERVSIEVVSLSDSEYELTVIPDFAWMSAKGRATPIKTEWKMISDEHEFEGLVFERGSISADGKVTVDGSGVCFKMHLPKLRDGMITKRVNALFHCDSVPIADDKDYILTLNRMTSSDAEAESISEIIGVSTMSVGKSEYSFDVTSEYSADESAVYALRLCEEQDGGLVAATEATALMTVSADSPVATYSVTETDGTSEEDSSSGEKGDIGSVGTYEVDLVSGKLNMEIKDFAWEGNRMPVTISRYYRGQYASRLFEEPMMIGCGWRLNLVQSMYDTGYREIDGQRKHTYTYTDETGEEIIFVQCECESGTCTVYEDINNLGYKYDASTNVMKKGNDEYTFVYNVLAKIKDEFGNTMRINYVDGMISSVEDGVGREFTFVYYGCNLIEITAPNGTAIKYQYCNNNLCCVAYPNGQKLCFSYGSEDNQPCGFTVSGNGIEPLTTSFEFDSSNKVKKITTSSNGTASGRSTEFTYIDVKQTVVTETDEGDETSATDEKELVFKTVKQHKVYLHDYPDKNYTYYETGDENKTEVYEGGMILPYTEPGTQVGNMRCENLLKNHNFDSEIISKLTDNGWNTNLTGTDGCVISDPSEGMPGFCSAYLSSFRSSNVEKGIWQTVELEYGKSYVFSCYLKLARGNADPTKGVYLMVKSANCSTVYRSPMISVMEDFQRVALPFTVNSACGTSFKVGICVDGNVQAKAIAPQLETGAKLSPYNYISADNSKLKVKGRGSNKCPTSKTVAEINVAGAKDARETFTLSCYISGSLLYDSDCYAALKAIIYYLPINGESAEDAKDDFWVPIYTNWNVEDTFAMLQFSKRKYRVIDYIEIVCENNFIYDPVTFYDIQLIRNNYVDGLSEDDFTGAESEEEYSSDTDESLYTSTSSNKDDIETIIFSEKLDDYGNALTGTNFKNGELGTIYTSYRYDDSNVDDAIGDAGNNKTEETDARGYTTRYEYDPVTSKLTAVIDRLGNRTEYEYDGVGRTRKITDANSGTVNYGYNVYDDLVSIARGDGQAYGMTYDAYRNLTRVKVGSQTLVTYNYKAGGNRLKSMTYANGARQTLTYDRFGNVIGEAWNNVMKYRYFYDASQNLVKYLDIANKKMYNINRAGENVTAIAEYDVASINATTYTVSEPTLVGTMHYSFDSDGKQFRKKYIDAQGNEQKYVFEYKDEQNVAVQLPTGVVSHSKSDHLGRKVFDELQIGKGLMNRRFSYHEGEITQTHLDSDKQVSTPETTLVKLIEFADGRTIEYEYDAEERITKVTDSVDGVYEYTYDELGQLLTETFNGVTVNTMTYDGYGNITSKNGKAYTYGNATWKDLLTEFDGKAIEYDEQGNPLTYLGHALTWEKGRQLKTFGTNTYWYNKDDICIKKQTATEIHEYVLDGTNIIKETVTDTENSPKYTNEYFYDLDGTVCGLKHEGTAYYFYKNLQGDVIAITDDTGATVARYTYDAWGKCTITSDTSGVDIAVINPFRYRGYYYDTETEFYYLQSRYYDPEVGRFINADDVEVLDSDYNILSINLYCYCGNNPVNEKDASGNIIWSTIIKLILGAIFGLFVQLLTDYIYCLIKLVSGKKIGAFPSSPRDYISSALSWAISFTNPFAGISKKSKLVYSIVNALITFVPMVAKYAGKKWQDISKFDFFTDLAATIISAVLDFVVDKKAVNRIKKQKSKVKKMNKEVLNKIRQIKFEKKILSEKISITFNISQTLIQLIYKVILGG